MRAIDLARSLPGRALAAVVGAGVAASLLVSVPADESGRVVDARPRADGSIEVRHVAGRQYLAAYRDIVGVWTICDGLTRGVRAGMTETPEGCTRRLETELVEHAVRLRSCTPQLFARGRDQQLHASISLSYNIGWPSFCASTAAKRFRAGDWRGGCRAIGMWNKAGRPLRVVPGLDNRRRREIAICMKGL